MTSSLNYYSFVTTEAIIMKMHDNRMRIVIKTNTSYSGLNIFKMGVMDATIFEAL